ncbi:MAG: hypothetical protein LBJ00_03750 [Planctomycetaceae bacterium]|nr:hypothetical protein [Planctomycetaceae bacterium]
MRKTNQPQIIITTHKNQSSHKTQSRWQSTNGNFYTVAGKAIGFAHEQPLHVVVLACSASGILK